MSLSCCWNRSKQKSGENKTLSTFGLMDPPTSPAAQNPSSLHSDSIISSLLSFHASTPFSIACSFDRELEKALASASDDASVQDRLLNRTIQLASLLLDSTERCFRKRASAHNSVAWVLPPELTVKVFSKLDTKSLMQAAACCTLFNKCAMDRSSYAHIDLTTADNEVVCTMIHRAGKELRSIKLGHVTRRYGPEPNPNPMWFNPNPLSSLSYNHGFLGSRLTSLRLYNVGPMHYNSLSSVLSVCSNLTDLRIVGSNSPYMNLFMTLSKKCRLIEHLCLVSHHPLGNIDASTASHLIELVTKSPNLTSLTLLCFQLTSETVRSLVQSCRKLKYLNLSRSPKIDGCFLRDLGNSCKESPLETLIMRNCVKLEEVFSMVDTKSLMRAAACCTMFNKCAMDRFAYAHVDLTTATSQVDSKVVCNLIHRAGKELRSLKLGSLARPYPSDFNPSLVNGPFLSTLSRNPDFIGNRLKSLGLYNIRSMNRNSSFEVLSVCSNLTDLRIVGLNNPFMHLFKIPTEKCRLIEHLCIETSQLLSTIDTVKGSHLIKFVTNSPNLTSLRLIRFRLTDEVARILAQSSRTLEYLNLSRSPTINGRFLRDVRNSCKESPLKTLIVRNCLKLQEKEVLELCNSLIKGNFKSIRHIDVSNNRGLVSDDGKRSYKPKFPLEKLKEERSDVTLVADFPSPWSVSHYPVCHEEDDEELRKIEMMEDDASSSDEESSEDDASSSDEESSEDDLG
ncbi:unnamed protein product [Brassica oleracea var. botrytis]